MSNTLTFRTEEQVAIFKHEMCGQISDGMWENSRPHDHYKIWGNCDVVSGENVGRDFYAEKDNYNLNGKELLDIVGLRTILYVKITKLYGEENVGLLGYLFNDDGNFKGLPTYEGKYYDEIREKLNECNLDEIRDRVANTVYTMKNLRADLKEMKAAMKVEK